MRGPRKRRFYEKYSARKYRVIADGKEIKHVFYYDGRRRIIGFNLTNAKGQYFITGNGEIARQFIKARRVKLVRTK